MAIDTASNEQLSEQEAKAKRRKIRQAKRLALIGSMLILVAVVAAMAIWGIMHLRPSDKAIQGQADCEVVRISGKLAGRLVELYVKEGDYVHKGQRLAKIYSSTTDATYSKAKEMKNVAANQNLKVERGTRYEIVESARKMVDQAKSARQQAIAAEEITRKTYERLNNLYNGSGCRDSCRGNCYRCRRGRRVAVADGTKWCSSRGQSCLAWHGECGSSHRARSGGASRRRVPHSSMRRRDL